MEPLLVPEVVPSVVAGQAWAALPWVQGPLLLVAVAKQMERYQLAEVP